MILVQMHGHPGSGKSTIARAIGAALPAVVFDKDIIHSKLWEAGIDVPTAAPATHMVMRAIAADVLGQGMSVILDNPCFWPIIEEQGRLIASHAGVPWAMVECACADSEERGRRLATRDALPSQPRDIQILDRPGQYVPTCERLIIDTTKPTDDTVPVVLAYLRQKERSA